MPSLVVRERAVQVSLDLPLVARGERLELGVEAWEAQLPFLWRTRVATLEDPRPPTHPHGSPTLQTGPQAQADSKLKPATPLQTPQHMCPYRISGRDTVFLKKILWSLNNSRQAFCGALCVEKRIWVPQKNCCWFISFLKSPIFQFCTCG